MLEELPGELHLAEEGFDVLSADLGEEELEDISGDEKEERHRFGRVEVVDIEVLGMHQAIDRSLAVFIRVI